MVSVVGKKRVTISRKPWEESLVWVVIVWAVRGEMLMPWKTTSKLGLFWKDSAASMSTQTAIEKTLMNENELSSSVCKKNQGKIIQITPTYQ